MANLTTSLGAEFTPAVGDFNAQCVGGIANLLRKNSATVGFAVVGTLQPGAAVIVSNPVAGAVYKFMPLTDTPVVSADQ